MDNIVTVFGITFKENVTDIRNSKVVKIIEELEDWGCTVQVCDPHANPDQVLHEYGIKLTKYEDLLVSDGIILAVSHNEFVEGGWDYLFNKMKQTHVVVYDITGTLPISKVKRLTLIRP
jgi:UDP-N-acetyl-D-galactosamine dehydrogenase